MADLKREARGKAGKFWVGKARAEFMGEIITCRCHPAKRNGERSYTWQIGFDTVSEGHMEAILLVMRIP